MQSNSRNVRRRFGVRRRRTRRFGVRRALGSGAKTSQWTSQGVLPRPLAFKTRRMAPRAWRRLLWRDTASKTHWRSFLAKTINRVTGTTIGVNTPGYTPALKDAAGAAFWTVAGGLQPTNVGGGTSSFLGDITLRGGVLKYIASAPTDYADIVLHRVWLIYTVKNPDEATFPTTAQTWGWDPMANPDFKQKVGHVVLYRESMLNNDNQSMRIEFRLRPEKIDAGVFGTGNTTIDGSGGQFFWMQQTINMTSTTSQAVTVHVGYNVSFSADVYEPSA